MALAALIVALVSLTVVVVVFVLAALGYGDQSKPLDVHYLEGHVGAVLQELGIAHTAPTASGNVVTGVRQLLGYSIRETAGATAAFRLRDGSASGTILAVCGLPANGTANLWASDEAIEAPSGIIYLDKVSGAWEGAIYTV